MTNINRPSLLLMLAVIFAGPVTLARADAPSIGPLGWTPLVPHCVFRAAGSDEADEARELLFVTELVFDDLFSSERGYMRIDGLLRELEFVERKDEASQEIRRYQTFGDQPVDLVISLTPRESRKSPQGQTVFVQYDGMITASREKSQRQLPMTGSCDIEPSGQK